MGITKDQRLEQFYPLILELHSMPGLNELLNRVLEFSLQAVDASYGLITKKNVLIFEQRPKEIFSAKRQNWH